MASAEREHITGSGGEEEPPAGGRPTCPLMHPNYFSVMIFVSVTELTQTPTLILTLTLNRLKNNSDELTDKYPAGSRAEPLARGQGGDAP